MSSVLFVLAVLFAVVAAVFCAKFALVAVLRLAGLDRVRTDTVRTAE